MKASLNFLQRFLQLESVSGIVLFLAAGVAILLANSPWAETYQALWQAPLPLPGTSLVLPYSLSFWINEGLMTLFFFVVGLELKRELISGELREFSQVILPAVAALGGMLIPALIYSYFNYQHPEAYQGWAIPVATDIAFALGVLALFNKYLPPSLKIFLMTLAIFDDVGAILIITFCYAHHFAWLPFVAAVAVVCLGFLLNWIRVSRFLPYVVVGLLLWLCVLQSGIHPTIAGVILALLIPHGSPKDSLLNRLEEGLHPWVAYLVMPLFALANAGFSVSTVSGALHSPNKVALGTIAGLFIGKQLGVFSFTWIFIRLGLAKLPKAATWLELWGVSILCGIGFTMSLFLGTLAFINSEFYMIEVRLGVFIGSILSGIMGAAVLFLAMRRKGRLRSINLYL